ncbi:MAG TPA: histidine kinase [Gemmatimonadaceae bacterium]|nr:histidine kinase [Gemmatimonadaceae bacterium]
MSSTLTVTATPAARSPSERPFLSWLRLQAALSATALLVVLSRSAQIAHATSDTGAVALWRPILATQAAFWLGWSLWAGLLVPLVRRLVDRPPSRAAGVSALFALAVIPPFVIPIVYAPVHWLMFERIWPIAQAYGHMATHDVLTNVLMSATIVGVVYGYLSLQRARRLEVATAQLNEQLTRAQLDTLRAQLNPHFLFNSLNSVAVLARRGKVTEVEHMVTRLADLLRHSLESARTQLVTLGVELEAVRRYLDIELVRFGDRLVVAIDVPTPLHDRSVPSFLLQPLVENAVRHGLVDSAKPLHVRVRAVEQGGRLTIEIGDDGAGIAQGDEAGDGIGLTNTRARLQGLYGDKASLALSPGPDGVGTLVTVSLPLVESDARARSA